MMEAIKEEASMETAMSGAARQSNLISPVPRRPFRLVDAMILVAAVGLACGITQGLSYSTGGSISWTAVWAEARAAPYGLAKVVEISADLLILTLPFAAMLSLAVIPLWLIGPRLRFGRLAGEPGITAMWAAGFGIALSAAHIGIAALTKMRRPSLELYQIIIVIHSCISYPGIAVLGTWVSSLLARRWRSEKSWVSRMGRVLGFFWVLVGVFVPIVFLLAGGL
jgi:hypothetical protein